MLKDTDNLIYKTAAENVYESRYKNKPLFEYSNYPKDSKYYSNTNNLVVGKMKHESCGMPIKVFVGLKSKIYTFITEDNHKSKKAKGVNKNDDDELKCEDYKYFLFNKSYV